MGRAEVARGLAAAAVGLAAAGLRFGLAARDWVVGAVTGTAGSEVAAVAGAGRLSLRRCGRLRGSDPMTPGLG